VLKTFLTPLQYNEIYSAHTSIVINGSFSEEKSYLLTKIQHLEAEIEDLRSKLENYETDEPRVKMLEATVDQQRDRLKVAVEELRNASRLLKNSYSPLLADALEIDEFIATIEGKDD
jgi:DNA repair exonuclease SbcCD ATPase subunit